MTRGLFVIGALAIACKAERPPATPAGSGSQVVVARPAVDAAVAVAVDALSSASPIWEQGPEVVVTDVVDGAALRARHRERIASDRSPVTVLTGGTPLELGKRL